MSQSHPRGALRAGRTDDGPATLTDSDDVQRVLDAVDDADCRAILEATRDDALTVNEVADACDLAQSTAYRKVDILDDAGLLEESLRIRQSGKHVAEYACGVDDVTLTVDGDGVRVTVEHAEPDASASFGGAFGAPASADD
ncbi:helix-turn-helix domain-containing protein [Halobacterium yunchengense]|uniref:helix-turn-helix domain-containing protein n=1 Tax=Halobacterium yunchengense TaxID=3108497 RepID=UPI003008AB55